MQSDKEKGLQAVDGRQAGARQRVQRTSSSTSSSTSSISSNSSIPRFTNASQLARRETTYLRWGTQRFRLAPLASLRRWPHE